MDQNYHQNFILKSLKTLPRVFRLGSDFFKQLFEIQKRGKVLLWNEVKCKIEACYSELILVSVVYGKSCGEVNIHVNAMHNKHSWGSKEMQFLKNENYSKICAWNFPFFFPKVFCQYQPEKLRKKHGKFPQIPKIYDAKHWLNVYVEASLCWP